MGTTKKLVQKVDIKKTTTPDTCQYRTSSGLILSGTFEQIKDILFKTKELLVFNNFTIKPKNNYYQSQDGQVHNIIDMSDQHLMNAILKLRDKVNDFIRVEVKTKRVNIFNFFSVNNEDTLMLDILNAEIERRSNV